MAYAILVDYDDTDEYRGLIAVEMRSSIRGRSSRRYSALARRKQQFLYNTVGEANAAIAKINPTDCHRCDTLGEVFAAPRH